MLKNWATVFSSAYASDYDDILHLILPRKIHLNVKDQLDPLKTCIHVIEPHDQRPLMTTTPTVGCLLFNTHTLGYDSFSS